MAATPLILERHPEERLAILTLDDRPVRNALTSTMRTALRDALTSLADDGGIDTVILTGAGGQFCAGGDIRTMGERDPERIRERMAAVREAALTVAGFPKLLICAIEGHAAGAGASLACLADLVVAARDAQFTFSHLRIALGPDWGLSHTLPRRVGAGVARRLILTAARIDGEEAARLGLADMTSLPGEALATARRVARDHAGGPVSAIGAVKALLGETEALAAALEAEARLQLTCFPAPEHQEGTRAFLEKRKPDFVAARSLGHPVGASG